MTSGMKNAFPLIFWIVVFIFIAVALSAIGWRAPAKSIETKDGIITTTAIPGKSLTLATTEGQDHWYTNKELLFSFRIPDGFRAPEASPAVPGSRAVIVENDAGNRLTVIAIPVPGITTLTPEDIPPNIPGAEIGPVQEGVVGKLVKGLLFTYRQEGKEYAAFWFALNGYVYELSTTVEDAVLLDFVLSSWRFAKPTPPPLPPAE